MIRATVDTRRADRWLARFAVSATRAVKSAVWRAAADIADDVRADTPVLSGRLRDSVRRRPTGAAIEIGFTPRTAGPTVGQVIAAAGTAAAPHVPLRAIAEDSTDDVVDAVETAIADLI